MKRSLSSRLEELGRVMPATVWCRTCGATKTVDALRCMFAEGWPKCCGYTMTIDPPETGPSEDQAALHWMPLPSPPSSEGGA